MSGKKRGVEGQVRAIPPNKIRAWRKYRGDMSLERLAELTGLAVSTISDVETRKIDITGKTLVELAHALDTTPAALLGQNPGNDPAPWAAWDGLTEQQKEAVEGLIRSMRTQT